jgi:hypothetical protein
VQRRDHRGDTTGGREVARAEIGGHLGFELVRRVAVAVADDDLVALEEHRAAAVGLFDPAVLTDPLDASED